MNPGLYPALPELQSSESGELLLAGHRASALLEEYGSPLVVLLEDVIRRNCRSYRSRLAVYPRSRVFYASKAVLTKGLCRLFRQEQLGLDVVSAGELHTALSAGFPAENISLHGNAKSRSELEFALAAGVGRVVIDNFDEISLLGALAMDRGHKVQVQLRVTPGVKPSTHSYVQTGQLDSKFGFNLEGGMAESAALAILAQPGLELVGIHCHIGSQILDSSAFVAATQLMLGFYAHLVKHLGAPLDELNLGGGLGIRYQPADDSPSIAEHVAELCSFVLAECARLDVPAPVLCDEPGRSIVGEAGVTLYTVQSTKIIPGIRNYASVDGGMTDNPRYALYQARHAFACADRLLEAHDQLWSVSGKCCESGDMLIHDCSLPPMQRGNLLAVFGTGAYTYSMASNYNRVGRPAVVLVRDGQTGLLARRETVEDVCRLDEIPAWLS